MAAAPTSEYFTISKYQFKPNQNIARYQNTKCKDQTILAIDWHSFVAIHTMFWWYCVKYLVRRWKVFIENYLVKLKKNICWLLKNPVFLGPYLELFEAEQTSLGSHCLAFHCKAKIVLIHVNGETLQELQMRVPLLNVRSLRLSWI